jgi:hypothetical protein
VRPTLLKRITMGFWGSTWREKLEDIIINFLNFMKKVHDIDEYLITYPFSLF